MMNGSTMTELPADVRSLFTGANYASLATAHRTARHQAQQPPTDAFVIQRRKTRRSPS